MYQKSINSSVHGNTHVSGRETARETVRGSTDMRGREAERKTNGIGIGNASLVGSRSERGDEIERYPDAIGKTCDNELADLDNTLTQPDLPGTLLEMKTLKTEMQQYHEQTKDLYLKTKAIFHQIKQLHSNTGNGMYYMFLEICVAVMHALLELIV